MSEKSLLKKVLTILLVVIIFSLIGYYLYQIWFKLSEYEWTLNVFVFSISMAILIIYLFTVASLWGYILKKLDMPLSLGKSTKIWFYSSLGKYLPGKGWLLVGRVHLCQEENIPTAVAMLSVFMELTATIISGLLIGGVALILTRDIELIKLFFPLFLVIPIGLVVLHPYSFKRLVNLIPNKLGKDLINIKYNYLDILRLIVLYFIVWIGYGFSFYLMVVSIFPVPSGYMFMIGSSMILAWIVGFVIFFVPGGIGVREGVLVALLSIYMPIEVAIIVSLVSRIWSTIAELICLGVVWTIGQIHS